MEATGHSRRPVEKPPLSLEALSSVKPVLGNRITFIPLECNRIAPGNRTELRGRWSPDWQAVCGRDVAGNQAELLPEEGQQEDLVDTESIAREIVRIKNRLQELDGEVEGASGTDVDDERSRLEERRRHLQDQLATHGAGESRDQDDPGKPKDVQYVPPA
jgi:hypothetical protein